MPVVSFTNVSNQHLLAAAKYMGLDDWKNKVGVAAQKDPDALTPNDRHEIIVTMQNANYIGIKVGEFTLPCKEVSCNPLKTQVFKN